MRFDGLHVGHVILGLGLGLAVARLDGRPAPWALIAAIAALGAFGMVLDCLGAFDRSRPSVNNKR